MYNMEGQYLDIHPLNVEEVPPTSSGKADVDPSPYEDVGGLDVEDQVVHVWRLRCDDMNIVMSGCSQRTWIC